MSVRGHDCGYYLSRASKTLATSLLGGGIYYQFPEEEVNLKFQRFQELGPLKIQGYCST